jgi:DNA-binding transcriptional regulator YiaG
MNLTVERVSTHRFLSFLKESRPIDKTLCRELQRMRQAWRIHIEELAEESGYTPGTIKQWEAKCKSRLPSHKAVCDWLDALVKIRKRGPYSAA